VTKVRFAGGAPVVPPAADGPVPVMMTNELALARSGALDTDLLAQRQFYGTDFTKPLLFIADGQYYANLAAAMHLTGDQWGVMNETGSYPGQPWLWLYQLWYHVAPFNNSPDVDVWAVYLTGIATLLLLAIPFIPGLRDIPQLIPIHRLIWRSKDYVQADTAGTPAAASLPEEAKSLCTRPGVPRPETRIQMGLSVMSRSAAQGVAQTGTAERPATRASTICAHRPDSLGGK